MASSTIHGWLYARTSSGLRWHRRYVVLQGHKLEIHGSESLEKEFRSDKDETVNSTDANNVCKKEAKARRTYRLAKHGTVSEISKADTYVARGIGFKQVDLNIFTITLPWTDKYEESDEEEDEDSGKVLKIRLGAESEKNIQRWRDAVVMGCEAATSKLTLSEDELASVKSEATDATEEVDERPVEPTMFITNLDKDQLKALTHTQQYRYVGDFKDIEVLEEVANPRTYIMSTIVRHHPQTVFEEFQLLGRVPGSDAWASKYESVEDVETLERSENSDVLHIVFMNGMFNAPRELVLERYWRLDEDGIYCLNFSSIEHAAAPLPPQTGLCGWNNVRLECIGGITISPLRPAYATGAMECLVTQVVQIKNSGGYLNIASSYGLHYADSAMVAPFAHNMAFVKHVVESARFFNGNMTVVERLQAAAAEKRAQESGRSQPALGTSVKAVLAVAKFKKALGGKKPGLKLLPLPSNVDRTMWYDPGAVNFKVRGPDYFTSSIKIQAPPPVFDFVAFQLFECDEVVNENIVARLPNHPLMSPEAADAPFTFIVNLMIPGPPNLNAVAYFRCGNQKMLDGDTPFGRVWRKFIDGDEEERNSRFKLIPTIVEGSWVIKQAVGSTPVIMGKKLRTTYHKGNNYIETDVDISNSKVACKVTGMCLGVTKSLVIDLAFCLEPHEEDELPEMLLGVARLKKLDLACREWLPGSEGAALAKKQS